MITTPSRVANRPKMAYDMIIQLRGLFSKKEMSIMFWVELFIVLAIIDVVVLWAALAGSKRNDDPIDFEVDKIPPDCAFKDYLACKT